MASNAIIGALRVVLGADSASLEKGLKDAQGSLDKFAANVKRSGVAMGVALTAALAGVGIAIQGAINEADKLGKLAQSIGVPVEELSKLKHAADLSGISLESMAKGVGRLNRNLVEAAQGSQTPIKAFEAMGIAIRNADGSLKTVSQALPEIADRFSKMRDGPEKTAFAMQLLGRAGAEMIPMLNGGAQGLRDMMMEAEQLGLVIDNRTAKAAELFNDNLTRMRKVFDGIVIKVTAEMLPAFVQFSQVMIDASKNSDLLKQVASAIVTGMRFMVEVVLSSISVFRAFAAEITGVWNAMKLLSKLDFSGAAQAFQAGQDESKRILAQTREFIEKFYADAKATVDAAAPALSKGLAAPIITAAQHIKTAMDQIAGSTLKQIAQLNATAQTYGMTAGASAAFIKQLELEEIARQKYGEAWIKYRAQIAAVASEYGNATLQADKFRINMELRTPFELMTDQLRNLDEKLRASGGHWEQYGEAVMRTKAKMAQAYLGMASEAAGLFGQIFKDSKTAAIAQATISAAEGVARSLGAYPMPFAGIMAALHAAAGAAQISRIRSVTPTGGGGGAGRAPAVATPSRISNEQSFHLRGMNPGSMFSRDSIMGLVEAINEATKDGVKLRIKVA
jgi:hypothetical protein